MIETCFNLVGLLLTGIGAFVTALSVIISKAQAEVLSGGYYSGNKALRDALLAQSRSAQFGLYCIVVGTVSQIVALIYPLVTRS